MPTLVAKSTSRHQRARSRQVSGSASTGQMAPHESVLSNAVGAATARDLARRAVPEQDDDAALVNAVARAAARSLAS